MPEYNPTNRGDEETDDLIKAPPNWLIRNGMILMALIFLVLIAGAYFIEYPDTVEGKGVIKTSPPPVKIYSPLNGKLYRRVTDSMEVTQNEIIAIINDTTGLVSPIDGFIYFIKDYDKNEIVEKGEALFAVIPKNFNYSIYVKVLPKYTSYVKVGQKCFIKIEEYPYQTFGLLEGKVAKINNLFSDSSYTVNLSIGKRLITTKMTLIPDKDKYSIDASIVIRNRSLLDRIIFREIN